MYSYKSFHYFHFLECIHFKTNLMNLKEEIRLKEFTFEYIRNSFNNCVSNYYKPFNLKLNFRKWMIIEIIILLIYFPNI